jgi:hypothetical protein
MSEDRERVYRETESDEEPDVEAHRLEADRLQGDRLQGNRDEDDDEGRERVKE